jgi:hypothetical protein
MLSKKYIASSFFIVSLYSIEKNEICNLLEKEIQLKSELERLSRRNSAGNVYDFRSIMLKSEINKVQNKLRILSLENDIGGNDIA